MAEQTLSAEAVIIDKASGTLKNIENQVKQLNTVFGSMQKDQRRYFDQMQQMLQPLARTISTVLNPALAQFGITSLGVTGIISGLARGISELAEKREHIRQFSEVTGFAATHIIALQKAAKEQLGDPGVDIATRSVEAWRDFMRETGRFDFTKLNTLATQLQRIPGADTVLAQMRELSVKGPGAWQQAYDIFHQWILSGVVPKVNIDEVLATLKEDPRLAVLHDYIQNALKIEPKIDLREDEALERWLKAQRKLEQSITGLKNHILQELVGAFDSAFGEQEGGAAHAIDKLKTHLKTIDLKGIFTDEFKQEMKDFKEMTDSISSALEFFNRLTGGNKELHGMQAGEELVNRSSRAQKSVRDFMNDFWHSGGVPIWQQQDQEAMPWMGNILNKFKMRDLAISPAEGAPAPGGLSPLHLLDPPQMQGRMFGRPIGPENWEAGRYPWPYATGYNYRRPFFGEGVERGGDLPGAMPWAQGAPSTGVSRGPLDPIFRAFGAGISPDRWGGLWPSAWGAPSIPVERGGDLPSLIQQLGPVPKTGPQQPGLMDRLKGLFHRTGGPQGIFVPSDMQQAGLRDDLMTFGRQGVTGVMGQHGVNQPGWSQQIAKFLQSPEVIATLGMAAEARGIGGGMPLLGKQMRTYGPQMEARLMEIWREFWAWFLQVGKDQFLIGRGGQGGGGGGEGTATPGTPGSALRAGRTYFGGPRGSGIAIPDEMRSQMDQLHGRQGLGARAGIHTIHGQGGAQGPAADALRGKLEGMIKGSSLEGYMPPDAARYGMKTGSASEWANLMTNMAEKESSFNPAAHGDAGRHGGAGSTGLFQLSPQDAISYRLQKTPFTQQQLQDPDFNARMAVKIAEQRIREGKTIGGAEGMAKYWAGSGGYLAQGRVSAAGPAAEGGGGTAGGPHRFSGGIAGGNDQDIIDVSGKAGFGHRFGDYKSVQGMVLHHTSGRGGVEGVMSTFRERNFPANYVIDRDGKIFRTLPEGAKGQHTKPGQGIGAGHGNWDLEGVEIIGKNSNDFTPAQVEAAKNLVAMRAKKFGYDPHTSVFGHGEINRHKEWGEGRELAQAIRGGALDQRLAKAVATDHKVTGSASINVDVKAPQGTKVDAKGSGMFNEISVRRANQMGAGGSQGSFGMYGQQ